MIKKQRTYAKTRTSHLPPESKDSNVAARQNDLQLFIHFCYCNLEGKWGICVMVLTWCD